MNDTVFYPKAYIDYLAEYHGSRDFFECHEIMEEHWKAETGSRYQICWLVFVRISVACYHARRGNWAGARKLMAKAAEEVEAHLMSELGMNGEELAERLREMSAEWTRSAHPVYRDFEFPIADPDLAEESKRVCQNKGWRWGTPLELVNADIVQRHLTRDRTHVVEARKRSAEQKGRSAHT